VKSITVKIQWENNYPLNAEWVTAALANYWKKRDYIVKAVKQRRRKKS